MVRSIVGFNSYQLSNVADKLKNQRLRYTTYKEYNDIRSVVKTEAEAQAAFHKLLKVRIAELEAEEQAKEETERQRAETERIEAPLEKYRSGDRTATFEQFITTKPFIDMIRAYGIPAGEVKEVQERVKKLRDCFKSDFCNEVTSIFSSILRGIDEEREERIGPSAKKLMHAETQFARPYDERAFMKKLYELCDPGFKRGPLLTVLYALIGKSSSDINERISYATSEYCGRVYSFKGAEERRDQYVQFFEEKVLPGHIQSLKDANLLEWRDIPARLSESLRNDVIAAEQGYMKLDFESFNGGLYSFGSYKYFDGLLETLKEKERRDKEAELAKKKALAAVEVARKEAEAAEAERARRQARLEYRAEQARPTKFRETVDWALASAEAMKSKLLNSGAGRWFLAKRYQERDETIDREAIRKIKELLINEPNNFGIFIDNYQDMVNNLIIDSQMIKNEDVNGILDLIVDAIKDKITVGKDFKINNVFPDVEGIAEEISKILEAAKAEKETGLPFFG